MNSPVLIALTNHLWQSTLFILAVAGLTRLLRKNSARVRYCLWLTASAKFLIPFALMMALGSQIPWPHGAAQRTEPSFSSTADRVTMPARHLDEKGLNPPPPAPPPSRYTSSALASLEALWALGTLLVATRWFIQWRHVRRALRAATNTNLEFSTPVKLSASQLEPAVVGILHPVLLLPKGMERLLAPEEMRSVLAHERCHVMWRDNLAAAMHMLVEALFWFHPLIWWLGKRLVDERERACDEHVLAAGHSRTTYAESILKVCEHYLQSRLACVAGMSASSLEDRIAAITNNSPIERLSAARKLLLAAAACTTMAAPVAVGMFTSTQAHALSQAPASDESSPSPSTPIASPSETEEARLRAMLARKMGSRGTLAYAFDPKVKMNKWSADHLSTAMNGTWTLDGNVHIEATFEEVREIHSPSRYVVTIDVIIDAAKVVVRPTPDGGSFLMIEKGFWTTVEHK